LIAFTLDLGMHAQFWLLRCFSIYEYDSLGDKKYALHWSSCFQRLSSQRDIFGIATSVPLFVPDTGIAAAALKWEQIKN